MRRSFYVRRRRTRGSVLVAVLGVAAASSGSGCTDPVRDAEIEALGPEEPGQSPGPDHRPGQPCLHCHSKGGPASNKPFAMAGTVFQTELPDSPAAEGVTVQFIDAKNGAPIISPETGPTGNFYVPLQDWPNLAYPVRVGLYEALDAPPKIIMQSLIGREGSCNYCHRRNPDGDLSEQQVKASRSSAGQIYLTLSGGK